VHYPWMKLPMISAVVFFVAGCQSSDKYYWGHYEDLIYVSYAEPGKLPVESQVKTMEDDLQKAEAAGKPVPPGFHAQLGYLYFQMGRADMARAEFETEKRLFPESTVLMDRMLANLSKR